MAESQSNALEVTVTELSAKLKRTVEDQFGHVRVRGEISGYRGPHSSGHSYFSLKDDKARLEAVIWRGQASRLKHLPEEGLEVVASGKLTTYPGSSKYQIVIDQLEPAGAGALMALLEERRKKLAAEGLFDERRKQLLPYMPRSIGVITSPTGAVIRDILHRISDRFPVHVIVWPVRVQGDTSGPEVANGIRQFNALDADGPIVRPDLLIVARGGGSLEDIWGFNDEEVVRAAADSRIPLISAVGHETDWTLIDLAADWRAPTPTAAAEKAVPVKAELEALIADYGARLRGAMSRGFDRKRSDVRSAARGLTSPDMLLALPRRRFDEASRSLVSALSHCVERAKGQFSGTSARISPVTLKTRLSQRSERLQATTNRASAALAHRLQSSTLRFDTLSRRIRPEALVQKTVRSRTQFERSQLALPQRIAALAKQSNQRFERADRLLQTLSYKGVLARGFAVVRNDQGAPIALSKQVQSSQSLSIEMQDGSFDAVSGGKSVQKSRKSGTSSKAAGQTQQGDLF